MDEGKPIEEDEPMEDAEADLTKECNKAPDSNANAAASTSTHDRDGNPKLLGYKKHLEKLLKDKPDMLTPAVGMEGFEGRVESGKIKKGYIIFVAREFGDTSVGKKLQSGCVGPLSLLATKFVESNVNQKYIFAHVAIYVGKWENTHYFVENGGPGTGKELLTREDAKKYDSAIRLIEAEKVIGSQPFLAITIPFGQVGEYHDGYKKRKRKIWPLQEELVQKSLASVGFPFNYHLRSRSCETFAMVLIDEPITNFENFAVDPWRNTNNSLTKTFCIEDCANYIPRSSLFPAESNGIDELDLSLEISPVVNECQNTSNQVSKKILSSSSKMDFLMKMILLLMFLIPFSTAQPIRMNHQFPPYHLKANNDKESILLPLDTNWDDVCELLLLIKIPSEDIGRTAFTAEHPKFGNGPLKFTIPSDGRSIWREQSFCFASCANVAKSPLLLSATSNMTLETNITIIPKIRKDACERITNPLSRPAVLGLIFVGTFLFTVILLLLVQRAKLAIKTLLNHDQTPKMDEFAIHSLLGQDQNPGKQ